MSLAVRDRMVVLSDIHVPYHDRQATKAALGFIREVKPSVVAINGDAIDFYAISRYSKDPDRRLRLADELGEFGAFLDDVDKVSGKAKKIFVKGNHEQRWYSYIRDHAVELEGLPLTSFPQMLSLNKRNIVWAPAGFVYENMRVIHGDGLFGSKGGQTATKWIDKLHCSVIVGHIHRLAIVQRRSVNGILVGVEAGTLSSMDPMFDQTAVADWQTGCVAVTRYKNGLLVPSLHSIIDGDVYGGLP